LQWLSAPDYGDVKDTKEEEEQEAAVRKKRDYSATAAPAWFGAATAADALTHPGTPLTKPQVPLTKLQATAADALSDGQGRRQLSISGSPRLGRLMFEDTSQAINTRDDQNRLGSVHTVPPDRLR
jgi:hypothetical protein